jgi:hypothetical protein
VLTLFSTDGKKRLEAATPLELQQQQWWAIRFFSEYNGFNLSRKYRTSRVEDQLVPMIHIPAEMSGDSTLARDEPRRVRLQCPHMKDGWRSTSALQQALRQRPPKPMRKTAYHLQPYKTGVSGMLSRYRREKSCTFDLNSPLSTDKLLHFSIISYVSFKIEKTKASPSGFPPQADAWHMP